MVIRYAILGLLSWKPFTGYELKKVFADSVALYWSGNSNQVYPVLVQLHRDGLVTVRTEKSTGYPEKKVYSITPLGMSALTAWVATTAPELPQSRSIFLTQLAWADLLPKEDLASLLDRYEEEVTMRLAMHREKVRRRPAAPDRTPRETFLWEMIAQHEIVMLEAELTWLARIREGLV